MVENWKTIPDFSNYQISDLGRVRNVKFNRCLDGHIDNFGYKNIGIIDDYGRFKTFRIHRLVGQIFVNNPNPNKFNVLNHINENKLDNRAINLEWCTQSYNHDYGNAIEKQTEKRRNIVIAEKDDETIIAKSGKDLKRYLNVKSAPHYAIRRNYLYYGYKVRIGFTISKNKLNGNSVIKIKNNKIVDIVN